MFFPATNTETYGSIAGYIANVQKGMKFWVVYEASNGHMIVSLGYRSANGIQIID